MRVFLFVIFLFFPCLSFAVYVPSGADPAFPPQRYGNDTYWKALGNNISTLSRDCSVSPYPYPGKPVSVAYTMRWIYCQDNIEYTFNVVGQYGLFHCVNGVQDTASGETGIDCGGNDCFACSTPSHCSNGTRDAGEVGPDCGGTCPNACAEPDHCYNGIRDSGEDGVDCGLMAGCVECQWYCPEGCRYVPPMGNPDGSTDSRFCLCYIPRDSAGNCPPGYTPSYYYPPGSDTPVDACEYNQRPTPQGLRPSEPAPTTPNPDPSPWPNSNTRQPTGQTDGTSSITYGVPVPGAVVPTGTTSTRTETTSTTEQNSDGTHTTTTSTTTSYYDQNGNELGSTTTGNSTTYNSDGTEASHGPGTTGGTGSGGTGTGGSGSGSPGTTPNIDDPSNYDYNPSSTIDDNLGITKEDFGSEPDWSSSQQDLNPLFTEIEQSILGSGFTLSSPSAALHANFYGHVITIDFSPFESVFRSIGVLLCAFSYIAGIIYLGQNS